MERVYLTLRFSDRTCHLVGRLPPAEARALRRCHGRTSDGHTGNPHADDAVAWLRVVLGLPADAAGVIATLRASGRWAATVPDPDAAGDARPVEFVCH